MKTKPHPENDIRHADRRHPVDFLEPLSNSEDGIQRICEVLSRTFGWVAEVGSVEQKGLRASIVLYCVRAYLVGIASLEELSALAGLLPSYKLGRHQLFRKPEVREALRQSTQATLNDILR